MINAFEDFLLGISNEPLRVLNASILNSDFIKLDLSKNNLDLQNVLVSSSEELGAYIKKHIKKKECVSRFWWI